MMYQFALNVSGGFASGSASGSGGQGFEAGQRNT
jgi:hypothetical protein